MYISTPSPLTPVLQTIVLHSQYDFQSGLLMGGTALYFRDKRTTLDITNAQPLNIANPTNTTAVPPCTSPNGYANDIVSAPDALATVNHRIADSFVNAHTIYYLPIAQTFLSQASIASFCLKRCISYQTNATGNVPCLSFSVDMGRPYPPVANDIELRWYCTAFDALLTPDLYEAVEVGVESHMHAVGVNRLCEGTYQAY